LLYYHVHHLSMTAGINPFTERGRITNPERFTGRWRELSLIFDKLEQGRPVMIAGSPGVGKSSLLTHVAQAAAAVLEEPNLDTLYLDMAVLDSTAQCYQLIVEALGNAGSSPAALEVALLDSADPVLICLDNVNSAVAAGWGADVLNRLGRLARSGAAYRIGGPLETGDIDLLLVAAAEGQAPGLSENYAAVSLGAFASSEIRLFTEAYLDGTGVSFSTGEVASLERLSAGHPAYLQRAAYHLYLAYLRPDYNWQTAYLEEARSAPIVGAPLPSAIFEGEQSGSEGSRYGDFGGGALPGELPIRIDIAGVRDVGLVLVACAAALICYQLLGNLWLALSVLVIAIAAVIFFGR
jgi:energy-coupling factor transporter ATP-binding protein EcfA2